MVSPQGTPTRPRFPLSPTPPPPPRPLSTQISGATPPTHPLRSPPPPMPASTQISGATPPAHPLRSPPLVPIPKVPRPVTSSSHPPSPQPSLPLQNAAVKPQEQSSEPPSPLALPSPHDVKRYNRDYFPMKTVLEPHNPKTDTRKQSETFKKRSDIGMLSTTTITRESKGAVMSAFVNSNVQGVNNSILYNSSVTHRHPGVRLSLG